MNSFHGRERELSELATLLGDSRLVTLTGAPGVGKSRLGLELTRQLVDGYSGGAALVELAPLGDGALVPGALAVALSVPEVPGESLADTVAARLGERRVLVVLDNCEHLIGACAKLVEELLRGCPQVRVLATSREPLLLEGERVWEVPPLSVPSPGDDADPEALMDYAAVSLFVERAADAQPRFALNAYVASDVAETCRRLDGMPLAIELAAARVETLTPREVAQRLEDRLSLLSNASRSPLPRHRTLEAALDWSYELLSPPERVLLRRLSVFAGRFELEAANAVCAGGKVDPPEISGLLGRLVSKSLLVSDAGSCGQLRYRLLETIRAYASEKLGQADEVAELRSAHARFYLALAERAEPGVTGPCQEGWLERLESERANLRAAIEWSLSHGPSDWAPRLAGALVLFWRVRCHFSEGRDLLDAVLSASEGEAPGLRGKALWGAGFLTFMAGDPERALPLLEESLARFRELADRQGCARALLILANCRQYFNDPGVLEMLEESTQLAREAGDHWCLSHALGVAGFECVRLDELGRARRVLEECLGVAREAEDKQGLRIGLLGLSRVTVVQGDYGAAEALLEEAVEVTGELGEDFGKATALRYLGALAFGRGDYRRAQERVDDGLALLPEAAPPDARLESLLLLGRVAHAQGARPRARGLFEKVLADVRSPSVLQAMGELAVEEGDPDDGRRLFGEACDLARARGHKGGLARALHGLGQLARAQGHPERAAPLHDEALELHRQTGELPSIATSLEAVAGLAGASGDHRHAARIFGAAHTLRERGGYARTPWESPGYEADLALVRQSLTAEELASAFAQGEALKLAEAVAEAAKGPRRTRPANGWPSLTEREAQVVELVAEGLTNREISEHLVISLETVKTHLSHVFSKLGMTGRSELAREARSRNGGPR